MEEKSKRLPYLKILAFLFFGFAMFYFGFWVGHWRGFKSGVDFTLQEISQRYQIKIPWRN